MGISSHSLFSWCHVAAEKEKIDANSSIGRCSCHTLLASSCHQQHLPS